MSDRLEVRVSDGDAEMLAIKAIGAALEPIDERAAVRVLKWADERYGTGVMQEREQKLQSTYAEGVNGYIEGLREAAQAFQNARQRMGVTNSTQVLSRVFQHVYTEATRELEAGS